MYALTGANGRLGRLVLQRLLMLVPANQVIATTRNPDQLDDFYTRGVVVRHADFNDPATLSIAFAGVQRLLIISTNDIGQRVEQHQAAIEAATLAGVHHIVYTSCLEAEQYASHPVRREHGVTEIALANSGVTWTALRNAPYAEALPYLINCLRVDDQLLITPGEGKPAWITREDCARTAAFVLAGKSQFSGPVDVTGLERLGLGDIAQRYAYITGQALTTCTLPEGKLIERFVAHGMTFQMANGIVHMASGIANDPTSSVSNIVERATGMQASRVDSVLRSLITT